MTTKPADQPPEAWQALPGLTLRDSPAPTDIVVPFTVTDPGGTPVPTDLRLGDPVPPTLVSCLMVTRGALWPAVHAIETFRRQTWTARELVVVDDSAQQPLAAVIAALADPRIRHVRLPPSQQTLGDLRNLAVALAVGDLVCQWDDDDLHDPLRIEIGVRALAASTADAVFLERWVTWWPQQRRIGVSKRYLWEGSMLARRAALPFYASVRKGEDTPLVDALRRDGRIASLDLPWLYCYNITGRNTWDALHFEPMFRESSLRIDHRDYAAFVDALDGRLPMREFERGLAAADAPADGSAAASSAVHAPAPQPVTTRTATPHTARADDPGHRPTEALPKVSVVVRSMGRPELVDALSSLALQTYADVEVIVVDATGGRHPPLPPLPAPLDVRLIDAGRPLARAPAANVGFVAATGDLFGMLDDDDCLEPTHVARLVARTREADHPDLVHSAGWLLDRYHRIVNERSDAYDALTAYFVSPFLPMAVLFARAHWDRGLRFDESFDVLEDWDFLLQLLQHARVGRVRAYTHFFFQEAGTSGTGIGRNRGAPMLAMQQRLHDRWRLRRNSQWLEHYKRFGPGLALQAEGRIAEARAHFARVLAATPAEPNALFQLGQAVGQEGTLYAARRLIEQAVRLNRNAGEYHMALGRIEDALGNDDDAIRRFEVAGQLTASLAATAREEIARVRARAAPSAPAQGAVGAATISRNALCPCGSGLRYKACHGRADAAGTGGDAAPRMTAAAAAAASPIASTGTTEAALATMLAAYRHGDLAAASAHCDRVLALDSGQHDALHARALLARDRHDFVQAQRAIDAMPDALRVQPEIVALQSELRETARWQRETARADEAIRALPFLRDRAAEAMADAPTTRHAHVVLSAHHRHHVAILASVSRLRAVLTDAASVTIWLADTDASMPSLPDNCRALVPEDDAFPRDGAIVFADIPMLPPTWLAQSGAERLCVRDQPERAAETLELLLTCHRATGLPVRLLHASASAQMRRALPGSVLPPYVTAAGTVRDRDASLPFVVGLAGHNDPHDFDPAIAPLLRALAAAGVRVRVRGGTLLLRHFAPSEPRGNIELLPAETDDGAAFLATIDAFLHWPGRERCREIPPLVHDAMAAGVPVVCARDADEIEAIDDGRNGFAFAESHAVATIVARLAADRALARRIGAAASASAQAWTGEAARARIQALLLR
jgi:tetratricopeptide (TPR) repeat protein